ncbi:hypothetical protein OSB04_017097 [Centaurea solstitialis]|uniref:Zinc finger, CCHC-type n=1 Tax=Centaurea solstitialis TaxID=347529 RepID=A0AA38WAE6_9ASTR|nr:hypothetical protein OSB04_017097 [Centaurea solstitialis]
MKVIGIGTVKLRCSNGKTLTLEKVLHVPKISKKIVYAGELTENGCVIVLHSRVVIHRQGSILHGEKIDWLYRLDLDHVNDISDDESYGDITRITSVRMVLASASRNLYGAARGICCPSDDKMIRSTNGMLKSKLDMKDMGFSDVILGIKITRTQNSLVLSQIPYVDNILEKFNQGDTSIARTPIDTSQHLPKNSGYNVAQLQVLSDSSSTVSAVVPLEQTTNLLKGIVSSTSLGYLQLVPEFNAC